MLVYKAYKFRMYPNIEQQKKLNSFMGTSRFIYNYFLDKKIKMYELTKTNYPLKKMKKDILKIYSEYEWLKEVDSTLIRTTLDDLDISFKNFYEKRTGYPKYKRKNNHDTYRTNCIRSSYKEKEYANIKVDLNKKIIKLPKLGKIKIKGYRHLNMFDKKIINATIEKTSNKYYVSVCVEEVVVDKPFILNSVIGIDLGIKNLVITSNGIKYQAMNNIKKYEKKLKGLNRWLRRTKRCSNNRKKVIMKIQRVNEEIKNMRKYLIHYITNKIVKENDLIITEDLNIKQMISKNKNLNKSLINSSLSEIIRQLKYKSKWENKKLIQINTYYPSSQICSHCGNKNEEVKDLKIRKWKCNKCLRENDRDINASINIMYEGITKYIKEQYS